ncbi:Microtubule-nucleating Tub4p (gamma-tubulin) complex component [Arthrobotrys musiformis]|uniref:Microtubule-nucleating Tub4p (Gamma-tubulin) complex component n=1 Tax=Arthrobotrys musiformis TaxID=47236 RepID=A0AAV9WEC5_9PEZI
MPSTRNNRIDEGLSKLIEYILPELEDEDEDEDLKANALELAQGMIDSHVAPSYADDPAHIANIIKNKLIRDNRTSDKALRFHNLYSRLLTLPLIKQKGAILHLLHELSEESERNTISRASERNTISRASERQSATDSRAPSRAGTESTRRPSKATTVKDDDDEFDASVPPKPFLAPERGDVKNGEPTKAAILAGVKPPSDPSEVILLKDMPFTLQGVSSKNLTFSQENTLKLPPNLPVPLISLLHTLAEPALLYRSLSAFVEESDAIEDKGGLVGQSLSAAIGNELKAYLSLVAGLEGEIRRATASLSEDDPHGLAVRKVGVTLRRCMIWTREATMGLRLMAAIVGESKGKRGGQLISIIHGFSTSHGDPFVFNFAKRLLTSVTRPFYDLLRRWVYDGELTDPYLEFFVIEQSEEAILAASAERKGHASSVWEDKYKLDTEMIPTIMTPEFANKVFLIGKSLNFIRYGCEDSEWVERYSKTTSKELSHDDYASLEQNIDEAYKTTMERLMHLMNKKFNLFEHLCALKKFLLLGQGDFIALLMESLSSNLDRPANTLYRHNLTAQLEHAIRGSNAQFESQEVLRRLDARMLELSHGEIGWDVFTLEYKIDPPVDVVVTPYGSREYLKVFNFLWRIKRVEFALGSAWKKYMTGARGVLASVADKVGNDWKVARCCIAEMIHFVAQLQYYILFQVIEPSWEKLTATLNKTGVTLDDLIDAHKSYLNSITKKGLLGGGGNPKSRQPETSFLAQLHEILKNMLAYKDAMDGLYSCSVAEFTRRQATSALIDARTAAGKWGVTEADSNSGYEFGAQVKKHSLRGAAARRPVDPDRMDIDSETDSDDSDGDDGDLPGIRQRLKTLTIEFQARTAVLLGDLASQSDMDMRFLGVMFSFNDFYVVKKGKGKTVVERRTAQRGDETPA